MSLNAKEKKSLSDIRFEKAKEFLQDTEVLKVSPPVHLSPQ